MLFPAALPRFLSVFVLIFAGAFAPVMPAADSPQPPVQVSDAWARATVASQSATGAFMQLTAEREMTLTGAASALAGKAEIHESHMEDGVMKMRPVPELTLSAGKTVRLQPGSLHIMLLQLTQPLAPGQTLPLTLFFTDKEKRRYELPLTLEIRAHTAPTPAHVMPQR